jgi:exosortase/archaeosortase family protein
MPLIGRALVFVAVFGALQFVWQMLGDSSVSHLLIDRGVVAPAAFIGRALTPRVGIYARGNRLLGPDGGINVVNGCDGMETLYLLVAGFSVAPLPWRARISGMLFGALVVYLVNLARILGLFYARHADMRLFDVMHGIVTPVLMVVSIAAFYYVWLRRSHRHPVKSSA